MSHALHRFPSLVGEVPASWLRLSLPESHRTACPFALAQRSFGVPRPPSAWTNIVSKRSVIPTKLMAKNPLGYAAPSIEQDKYFLQIISHKWSLPLISATLTSTEQGKMTMTGTGKHPRIPIRDHRASCAFPGPRHRWQNSVQKTNTACFNGNS